MLDTSSDSLWALRRLPPAARAYPQYVRFLRPRTTFTSALADAPPNPPTSVRELILCDRLEHMEFSSSAVIDYSISR